MTTIACRPDDHRRPIDIGVGLVLLVVALLLSGCGSSKTEIVEYQEKDFRGRIAFDEANAVYYIRDIDGTRLSPLTLEERWRDAVGAAVFGTYRILEEEEIPDSMIVLDVPIEILSINAWVINGIG